MEHISVDRWSAISGWWVDGWLSVEDLSVDLWSVGWLSMVGGQWSTCSSVGCRSSVVSGSVEDQSVGRWSVVGSRWSVACWSSVIL